MMIWQKLAIFVRIIATVFVITWIVRHLILKKCAAAAERNAWRGSQVILSVINKSLPFISLLVIIYISVGLVGLEKELLTSIYSILFILVIILGTIVLSSIATGLIETYGKTEGHGIAAATLTRNMARAIIVALGFLVLFNHLGIAIAPMLTAMGIGGVAVALGLQETLANIFAGIYIIWAGRIRIGDYIKLSSGEEGYVHDIAWRETRIRMMSDNIVTVPNSQISKVSITNFDRPTKEVGFSLALGVAYQSDLDHVERVTLQVARDLLQSMPGALSGFEPYIRYQSFADYRITLNLNLRAIDYASQSLITHELLKRLHAEYYRQGISIPFPTRTIIQEPAVTTTD